MKNLFQYYEGSLSSFLPEAAITKDRLLKIIICPISERLLTEKSLHHLLLDTEFNHVLDNFAIRHILMKHSNEKEVLRGQILVVLEDFLLLQELLTACDSVNVAVRQGRDVLIYQKSFPDFVGCYVEEIRCGRKELAGVTFYKKKKVSSPTLIVELR